MSRFLALALLLSFVAITVGCNKPVETTPATPADQTAPPVDETPADTVPEAAPE